MTTTGNKWLRFDFIRRYSNLRDLGLSENEVIYESARLLLEPLVSSHAAELYETLAAPEIFRFIPQERPSSLASLVERCQRLESRQSADGNEVWLNWVVRLGSSKECVGRVQATIHPDRSASIGYEFGVSFWGQGYGTESVERMIRALFEDFGVHEVRAEVDTRNLGSMALLEHLNFDRGELRKDADFFKGEPSDEFTYTLTRTRFRSRAVE
ncbi:MAG: ribosomal-protein-alanine N-acetyltransferase [Planctomycetota bacterium]